MLGVRPEQYADFAAWQRQILQGETGFVAQDGMTAVSGNGQIRCDLQISARAAHRDAADTPVPHDQVFGLGLHQQMKIG